MDSRRTSGRVRQTYRIVLTQCVVAVLLIAVFALWNTEAAMGGLWGSAVGILPNAWLAWRMASVREAPRLLGLGSAKVLLTLALLAAVLYWMKPEPLGFFVALTVVFVTHGFAALRLDESGLHSSNAHPTDLRRDRHGG